MTNEQFCIEAEGEIEKLKQNYMDALRPVAIEFNSVEANPPLELLLDCDRKANSYFNYVESLVGNSGLLGAHNNGKWVMGFAETCYAVLESYILHVEFLRSHSAVFAGSYKEPGVQSYANMQRITKEYLEGEAWQELEARFVAANLPITGFKHSGASDVNKVPNVVLVIGVVFFVVVLLAAIMVPNPTFFQSFVFRACAAISLAAIAGFIPGLLTIESRFKTSFIRASGAIAVFVIIWLINPPAMIAG